MVVEVLLVAKRILHKKLMVKMYHDSEKDEMLLEKFLEVVCISLYFKCIKNIISYNVLIACASYRVCLINGLGFK